LDQIPDPEEASGYSAIKVSSMLIASKTGLKPMNNGPETTLPVVLVSKARAAITTDNVVSSDGIPTGNNKDRFVTVSTFHSCFATIDER
jgi:hypothetical protein